MDEGSSLSCSRVLQAHTAVLVKTIGNPGSLAAGLFEKKLIPFDLFDELTSSTNRRGPKAVAIVKAVHALLLASTERDGVDVLKRFCCVLEESSEPALAVTAISIRKAASIEENSEGREGKRGTKPAPRVGDKGSTSVITNTATPTHLHINELTVTDRGTLQIVTSNDHRVHSQCYIPCALILFGVIVVIIAVPMNTLRALTSSIIDAAILPLSHTSSSSPSEATSTSWTDLSMSSAKLHHTGLGEDCHSYAAERINNGYRNCVYYDTKNNPIIGVGFNLNKDGARAQLERVGADYNDLMSGKQCLYEGQIKSLFNEDMETAIACVSSWLPNWSVLGSGPRSALADMAFNMGCTKVKTFKKMRAALTANLSQPDYVKAVVEMHNSKWCRSDVPNRCERDVVCMKSGADP